MRFIVLAFAVITLAVGVRAGTDPLIGDWRLNVAKSKFGAVPGPASEVLHITAHGDNGLDFTSEVTSPDGKTHSVSFAGVFDGKEIPITGDPNADHTIMKRIDAYTTERINEKDGKITTTIRRTVSKDGKTFTVTQTGTNAQGQSVHTVTLFERQ